MRSSYDQVLVVSAMLLTHGLAIVTVIVDAIAAVSAGAVAVLLLLHFPSLVVRFRIA